MRRKPGGGSDKPKQAKYALFAVGTIAALAFSMMWNPPTKTVHSFTKASDYVSEKESGCTNSGQGCHGSENSYADFNTYHPNAECTDCHDYEGVGCIPCHSPREHECALCHDGSMKAAPDRVRITDSFPNGHYRETSHTVTATDMSARTRVAKKGKASAACEDCHSRELRAAHTAVPAVDGSAYGSDVGCGECHNDLKSFGQAEVLSDWKQRSCEACHKVGSSSPMHGSAKLDPVKPKSEFGCASSGSGCHESTDLHALHADEPKTCSGSAEKGEPGCHKLGQEAALPVAKSCGGSDEESCHRSSDRLGYVHKNNDAHSPGSGVLANTTFNGAPCGGCHYMDPSGVSLLTEHAGISCEKCHNDPASAETIANGWEDKDTSRACSSCHDGSGIAAAHLGDFSTLHTAIDSEGCANTATGCHPTSILAAAGGSTLSIHADCLDCHNKSASIAANLDANDRSCGSGRACHEDPGAFDMTSGSHTISSARVDGTDARSHRAGTAQAGATWADQAAGTATECSSCHSVVLGTEHSRSNSVLRDLECAGCHNGATGVVEVIKSGWSQKDSSSACSACHDGSAAPASHANIASEHLATEFDMEGAIDPGYCSSAMCHSSADVRTVHAGVGCTIAGCHSPDGDISGSGIRSCGGTEGADSCHNGDTRHRNAPIVHTGIEVDAQGTFGAVGTCQKSGCHATTELRLLHRESGCKTQGCHGTGASGIKSCGGKDGQPGVCHSPSSRHTEIDARHKATEIDSKGTVNVPGSCAKTGCHATTDVRLLHATTSCQTAGCHVEHGPTSSSCGGVEGQPDACHGGSARHKDINTVHTLTELSPDGNVSAGACTAAGCHKSTDARALHAEKRCSTPGCHTEDGPEKRSCGGADGDTSCHVGMTASTHPQSHSVSAVSASNAKSLSTVTGCVGECHDSDLVKEHRVRRLGGSIEGGGDSVCAVCHAEMSGAGRYASLPAVKQAIATGDRTCSACHSGDREDRTNAPSEDCEPATSALPSVSDRMTAEPEALQGDQDSPAEKNSEGGPEKSPAGSTEQTSTGEGEAGRDVPAQEKDVVPPSCPRSSDEETATATRISGEESSAICLDCHTVSSVSESVSQ